MARNTNDPIRLPAAPFIHPDLNSRVDVANALPPGLRDAGMTAAIIAATNYALANAGGGGTTPVPEYALRSAIDGDVLRSAIDGSILTSAIVA